MWFFKIHSHTSERRGYEAGNQHQEKWEERGPCVWDRENVNEIDHFPTLAGTNLSTMWLLRLISDANTTCDDDSIGFMLRACGTVRVLVLVLKHSYHITNVYSSSRITSKGGRGEKMSTGMRKSK